MFSSPLHRVAGDELLELSLAGSKLIDLDNALAIAIPDRLRGALDGYGKPKVMLGVRPEALRPAARDAISSGAPLFSIDVAQHLGHEEHCSTLPADRMEFVARVAASDNSRIGEKRPFLFRPGPHASLRCGHRRQFVRSPKSNA